MRKFILVIALTLMGIVGASAQEAYVGGQYVYINTDVRQKNFRFDQNSHSFGAVGSYTKYATINLGVTGEVGAAFNQSRQSNQLYTALGGLTLKSRRYETVQPYLKGLVGLGVLRVSDNAYGPSRTDSSLAYKLGAGVDVGKHKVKFRVVEAGYMRSYLFNTTQNSVYISSGVVF